MKLNRLTAKEFEQIISNADKAADYRRGRRVFHTADGRVVKLFRSKRSFSTARFYPYALRFMKNAETLLDRGVKTVSVQTAYSIPEIRRQAVVYEKLPGVSLRDALSEHQDFDFDDVFERFSRFFALLHDRGISFRSIHLDNVIFRSPDTFALIDIADLSATRGGALGVFGRARNFRHLARYPEDVELLRRYGSDRFVDNYLKSAQISRISGWMLRKMLGSWLK